jgi:hypothetical protein
MAMYKVYTGKYTVAQLEKIASQYEDAVEELTRFASEYMLARGFGNVGIECLSFDTCGFEFYVSSRSSNCVGVNKAHHISFDDLPGGPDALAERENAEYDAMREQQLKEEAIIKKQWEAKQLKLLQKGHSTGVSKGVSKGE